MRTQTPSLGVRWTVIARCRPAPRAGVFACSLGGLWQPGLALLTLALALGMPALSADTQPELEFQPSAVSLPIGVAQPATALVVVHNRSGATLRDVRLTWRPAPGLDVQPPSPLSLSVLAPHADYVWTLTIGPMHGLPTPGAARVSPMAKPAGSVTVPAPRPSAVAGNGAPPETRIDENLDLRLEYKTVSDREVTQVILKSLPVRTQDLSDLDKAMDVQIRTALESLDSSQSGFIYLVLKNNSARTISITSITPIGKGDLYCGGKKARSQDQSLPFCFSSTVPPAILTPYQTLLEQLLVKAGDRVKAGKYLLVFQIATQSYEGGAPLRRNIVVSQAVDVAVLGDSAILKVAGIPAFFLLPGTLLLLTIGLCRKLEGRWWPVVDEEEFPLEYTEPSFWLVSVTISLVIAFVPWLFTGSWYFTRYGLQDIAFYWFCSITFGVFFYALWWIVRHNRRIRADESVRMRAEQEERVLRDRTFSEVDSPIDALQKLQRHHEGLRRKRVLLKSKAEPAFVLAGSPDDAVVWVCPAAKVECDEAARAVETAIREEIDKKGDAGALLDLLRGPHVTARWLKQAVDKVSSVPKEQIESWEEQEVFIQTD